MRSAYLGLFYSIYARPCYQWKNCCEFSRFLRSFYIFELVKVCAYCIWIERFTVCVNLWMCECTLEEFFIKDIPEKLTFSISFAGFSLRYRHLSGFVHSGQRLEQNYDPFTEIFHNFPINTPIFRFLFFPVCFNLIFNIWKSLKIKFLSAAKPPSTNSPNSQVFKHLIIR